MDAAPAPQRYASPSSEAIRTWLRLRLAALLRMDAGNLADDEPLAGYGLGSVDAVSLSGELEEWLGRSLPPTLAYEYPTIAAISDFLSGSVPSQEQDVPDSQVKTDPIAIVGVGCRFPAADGPDAFWQLLLTGKDAIRNTPQDRWDIEGLYDPEPSAPGKMNTRWGGFIDRVDQFDAQFFGISPREAVRMDPQQRILLELTWEALEDAGAPAEEIAGRRGGVFIGISTNDYAQRQFGDIASVDAYTGTGNALSIAANRISYFLDLHGPSMAVDTACSSSLVAVHLACQSLWRGESEFALAGGVNLILSPAITINFTKAGVSAPDGRCKTFDDAANGYVRGEGAAIVVLKPLSSAQRDGDRIYALIRGSAVSQDGRTNGLMAPNPKGQEAVLREAYREAGVPPGVVDYVETHGTGTSLGDQIEAQALGAVLSTGREAGRTCFIGSVKSNIGHLEAAAGIAGLIKVALSLKHRWIPPSLHFNTPNPNIPFAALSLAVAQRGSAWPGDSAPALAGVSSFGFGGTNAHVVLQEFPQSEHSKATKDDLRTDGRFFVFPISARSPEALAELARAWRDHLQSPVGETVGLQDLCYTAAARRMQHDYRLGCVACSKQELIRCLEAFSGGEAFPGVFSGRRLPAHSRKPVFVFSGQGSQWTGMARGLLDNAVFRASLESCDAAIRSQAGWSPIAELLADESQSRLDQIDVLQPVLFAVHVALSELWQSWGVKPAAVVGHSMGEVAAAYAAKILDLADAVRIICARSRLLKRASGGGGMLAVELPEDEVRRRLGEHTDAVVVAVHNSRTSTILSGETAMIAEALDKFEKADVFCRLVSVDVAAHSPQMEALRDDLLKEVASIAPKRAGVPFYSTVAGGLQPDLPLDAAYWARNLRQPVLFWQASKQLIEDGHDVFIEISPHPILTVPIQQTLTDCGKEAIIVPSLRRNEDAERAMMASLAALYSSGLPVDWKAAAPNGRIVPLPPYPWQRQRYWLEADVHQSASRGVRHSILGPGFKTAKGQHVWEIDLNGSMKFLDDHRIEGAAVMPAAAYVEIVLAAAQHVFGEGPKCLKRIEFRRALVLPDNAAVKLQAILTSAESNSAAVEIYSADGLQSDQWSLHATALVGRLDGEAPAEGPAFQSIQTSCPELSTDDYYAWLAERGLEYGPNFRLIERIWRGNGQALAKVAVTDGLNLSPDGFLFHPALLDACLQSTGVALALEAQNQGPVLPVRIRGINLYSRAPHSMFAYPRLKPALNGRHSVEADITVLDETGAIIAEVQGLELTAPGARRERGSAHGLDNPDEWLYAVEWRRSGDVPVSRKSESRRWIIFSDGTPLAGALEALFQAEGDACTTAHVDSLKEILESGNGPAYTGIVQFAGQDRVCEDTLHLVQALASIQMRHAPRLWLATRGAQRFQDEDLPGIAQSPLWGLGKVIAQEHPEWRCSIVDLDPAGNNAEQAEARQLFDELSSDGSDRFVGFRRDGRYIPWLCPSNANVPAPAVGGPVRLERPSTGVLDDLAIRPAMRPLPRAGEIVIEVAAAGLNFLDVLKALAIAPEVTGIDGALGAECAGRIVAVGEGVENFVAGDEVVAIAPSSFATYAATPALLAVRKPASLSFEEAATIPIAFVTAYYALHHVGRLNKGERVLIHAASGGVGLAAIQIAQRIGAEVYGTAGSPEKRAFVRSLGVRTVMDSRTLTFADEIMEETAGAGVDVVLNSLAGEAIPKGLSVLGSHGRFVEIGKRDIYQDSRIGLLAFKRNLSFHAVDLTRMCLERPAFVGSLLREVVSLVADGAFRPLHMRVFPFSEASSSFRQMAQAKHIGKIVLAAPPKPDHSLFDEEATYLITGGLGGLGMLVTEWMVREGARHLALVGRRAPSEHVGDKLDGLRADGAEIAIVTADVSDHEQVVRFLNQLRDTMPPLKGIIHAAGTLDDGILLQQTEERFHAVTAPKIDGAWNLHVCTLDHRLDFFVLFSSVSSVLGSPGQGNYAAANAFLDGLAHYRQSRGLPAVSINWGPWSEVGLAARADRGGRLASAGFGSISPQEGLTVLQRLFGNPDQSAQIAVMPVDRQRWTCFNDATPLTDVLAEILSGTSGAAGPGRARKTGRAEKRAGSRRVREMLWKAAPSERPAILEAYLCEQAGQVLRLPGDKVDVHQPLRNLGIDSLMGVELKNRIESELGASLPIRTLLQGPTILQLVAEIADRLSADSPTEPAGIEGPALPNVIVEKEKKNEPFALNEIQQAYWLGRGGFFEMGNVAAHVYGEVDGRDIDVARLEWAWQRLIERHDMLRAVVLPEGRQQILKETPRYEIQVEDLRREGAEEEEQRLERIRQQMSHQVREADQWPLFEIRASRRRGGGTRLHISLDLLIADAWSILLMMREWEQLYRNPDALLPALELSFRDYVQAESELEGSALRKQSAEYWQARIATLAGAPELPLAKSPAEIEQPRFARRSGRLEPDEWRRLKKQAQQAGLTPSMLLCAAFAEVLGSWSKTQRFTINVTMFNRLPLHEQVHQIVGDFTTVNLLEVERGAGSFQQQAERVQQQLWEDLEHRYWSGLQVMRESNRMKGGGATAAMPIVFTSALAQTPPMSETPGESVLGWLGRLSYGISQTPQVWLDHQIYEDAGALIYNWDAVEELFPEGVLDAMFQAYRDLLARLIQAADWQSVPRLLVSDGQLEERRAANATEVEERPRALLDELFDEQVKQRGDQDAVIAGSVHLSYGQLQKRAEAIATWLMPRGSKRNRLVGVVMEKGWEQAAAVLGTLKAGAAYVPIDAAVPAERLQYLLGHSEVELVLTQSWLQGKLAWPEGIPCLAVDQVGALSDGEPLPIAQRSPSDLAYVIYTSGSTGQPKGVMIDHRAAVNTIVDMNRRFGVGAEDRVLALSSLSFDLSVYDIFGILACGGTLVIPDAAAGPDPAHWVDEMSRHGVTLWNSVPALMEMLVDYVETHGEKRPPALRQVWMSGDWIPPALPERIRRVWERAEVISLGGATEAAIWSIYHRIGEVDRDWASIPYGRPLGNQRWHVLNSLMEPCPVWVAGHLYIAGDGLAQGYWKDDEKTQGSFVTDARTGERLYRTGDLGRYLPGGTIEFLGREDFQVKVQGHRIELGEIEAALDQHPGVRTSVVAAIGEARGAKRLVAYIVPSAAAAPEPAELRRHLEDKLPDYMIPAVFVTLASLPLSPNGKVDRRALPSPEGPSLTSSPELAAGPSRAGMNETTRKVGDIIARILKMPRPDPAADLRELGMNSMDMMRIANLLEETFGFRPRIGDLFRFTTASALAGAIDQHIRSSSDSTTLSKFKLLIDPEERERFKMERPGLRRLNDEQTVLPLTASDETWTEKSLARRSHRQFSREAIPAGEFSKFMSMLREVSSDGHSRHLYGSAGAIYAVQTYVHLKPGRIEGMRAGLYYYHPVDHGLVLLAPEAEIPAAIHESFVNRPVFEQAAFSLFFVARLGAIAPMYGEHSLRFAAVEAGLMCELLEMSGHAYQIGLCQIGTIDFDRIRALFDLEESDELVHSLVGGRVDSSSEHEEGEF